MGGSRILYLDGLRGILALVVFLHHFLYAFCPRLLFGGEYEAALQAGNWTFEKIVALTPINILFNPGMAVNFFFLLSGYVQSRHYLETGSLPVLQKSFIKRYFRLAIPTLAIVLLVFSFYKAHWLHKELLPPEAATTQWAAGLVSTSLNLWEALKYGLFGCFTGQSQYYQVLWTMPVLLNNSLMMMMALIATHNLKNKTLVYVLWIAALLFLVRNFYGVSFMLGMLICRAELHWKGFGKLFSNRPLKMILLLSGLYLASYPYLGYDNVAKPFYAPISFFERISLSNCYYIGNSLLFLALLSSPGAQRFLSKKPLLFFGNVSFMFYLVHLLLLLSFSPWLYSKFAGSTPFGISVLITFVASLALTTGVSWLLTRFVDRPVLKLCDKFIKEKFGI